MIMANATEGEREQRCWFASGYTFDGQLFCGQLKHLKNNMFYYMHTGPSKPHT